MPSFPCQTLVTLSCNWWDVKSIDMHRRFHRPVTTPIDVYHALMCHWWKLQQSELGLAAKLSHLGLERNVFDGTILATWFLSELEGRFTMVSKTGLLTDTHSCATYMYAFEIGRYLSLGPLLPWLHRAQYRGFKMHSRGLQFRWGSPYHFMLLPPVNPWLVSMSSISDKCAMSRSDEL